MSCDKGKWTKILVVSDTHRRNENFLKLMETMGAVDRVIHCGDVEESEYVIEKAAGCPVTFVAGNNDFFSDLEMEEELQIGKYRVWVTHGHNYYVSMTNEILKQEAVDRGVDIVLFGHTHKPVVEWADGVAMVNPGSLSYPRQAGRKPSYVMMELDPEGEVHFTVGYL